MSVAPFAAAALPEFTAGGPGARHAAGPRASGVPAPAPAMYDGGMIGAGYPDRFLAPDETRDIVREALASLPLAGKRVLFIIPDGTRTMPMPELFALFRRELGGKVAALDFLVALGTHPPMDDAALSRLVGQPVAGGRAGASNVFNHEWADPRTFVRIGEIPAAEIAALTGGRLAQPVPVSLNRRIFDYDRVIICGPVFPHEVVGFSGGNKYFFPGIAGPEIIDFTHWLGALITNFEIIGAGYTPVRAVIDRAASLVTVPTSCFALVVTKDGLAGCYFGSAREAWERA
jgi:nickel-dependent lactate racemase